MEVLQPLKCLYCVLQQLHTAHSQRLQMHACLVQNIPL